MSNKTDIAIYYTSADNAEGWVDVLSNFLVHYVEQKKAPSPSIQLVEYGNSSECNVAIAVLSNNTIDLDKIEVKGENLFIAEKAEIQTVSLSSTLGNGKKYRFFEKDAETGQTSIFNTNATSDIKSLYWMKLLDIAKDVFEILHPNSTTTINKGKTIYLAEVSNDQLKNRDAIKRELQRHGFNVVPSSPLPENLNQLKEVVVQELDNCSLSIHIVGSEDATLNSSISESKVEIQNQLASQYVDKVYSEGGTSFNFSRFLWISPDLQFQNEQQQDKVDELKRDIEALKGAEIVQTPMEIFKSIVLYRMSDNYKHEVEEKEEIDYTNSVYVIFDQFEKDSAKPIVDAISASGKKVLEPIFEGEQIEIINHHRNCLVNCDSLLVVYHNNNPKWALSKVNDMRKSPGFGRIKRFKSKAIYLDRQDTEVEKSNEIIDIITSSGQFSTKDLDGFLSKLN
ncbi:MAG: hypothetical protein JKY53_14480 [Flavobacteriales bacterium]|nr:hypothetical protein [Flavobacteriales bacterium]